MNFTKTLNIAVLAASAAAGCVGTELEVPTNHPGHPQARAGRLPESTAFAAQDTPSEAAEDTSEDEHTGHQHGVAK